MKSVNSRIKQALKGFTTQRKGRILVNGNYYEVYNVEYYADCYDDGKVIGNAIASQLDFDLPYMPKFDTFKYYDGVWTGSSYEYVDMGTFNVFDEKDQDEFNKHITAFDNLIKFNVPFEEVGTYPKTLYAELQNICNQAGVTLGNLSIPNGGFIIENNQYVNGESLKTVLKQICGISGNYAIMKDNTLYLQLKNTTDEVLDKYQHTPTDWKRRSYGINQVIIGDSQVEGEYVIREDAEDIELNGVHKLEVLDNLFAYTQDKRDALIDALWNQVRGFGYVPYETSGEWLSYLEIGDTITIDDVETMLLRINAKSPKAVESTISAPAIIDSSIEYVDNTNDIKNQLRRTEVKVDKQNQTIELLASEVEETQEIVEIISTPIEEQTGMPMYIENAEGGRLIDMELYGDTYQTTYSGKNLLELPNTQTINGITLTKNNDGTFNLSGTATANADFIVEKALDYISTGYYTASVENTGYQIQIAFYNNNSWLSTPFNKLQQEQTKTSNVTSIPSNANKVRLIIRVTNGVTINLQNEKAQLEKGSTATDYEPYVGGYQSPNPEYPQIVQTVTGKQEVEVVGENIFVPTLKVGSTNIKTKNCTVTLNEDEYSFVASGTDMYFGEVASSGLSYPKDRGTLYEINDADTIYLYCTNNTFNKNYITWYDKNEVSLGYNSINNSKTNGKTVPANAKYFTIRLGYGSAVSGTTYTTKVMVSYKKIIDYEPYQGATYEINLGKNLFDEIYPNNALTYRPIFVGNGTFTLSTNTPLNTSNTANLFLLAGKVNSGGSTSINGVYINRPITVTTTDNYVTIGYRKTNGVDPSDYNTQLEKGSTVSPYSAYKTPIELCKIDTYQDSIKKSTGKNLFDKDNANILNMPVNGNALNTSENAKSLYISITGGKTYTIQKIKSSRFRVETTQILPTVGVSIDNYLANDDGITITINTSLTANYLLVYYFLNGTDTLTEQEILNSIQIEENSVATDPEPYGVGKWYVCKKIGKVTLDGSSDETYSYVSANSNANYSQFNMRATNDWANMNTTYSLRQLYLSNYFSYYDGATGQNKTQSGFKPYNNNDKIIFSFPTPLLTSGSEVSSFKTWLDTHNTIVYYILQSPTYTEINDTELINQLNKIELLTGINNISITSEDLTAGVYMKYYLKTPLSGTYVKTEELNAKLTITTEEITSEVSATYETKMDATSKLNGAKTYADGVSSTAESNAKTYAENQANTAETNAKGYTDGQLTNYSTTTEMNSAITQKANEITSTVAETYSTKAETTTAKNEAIASANSTTDDKLSSYSTTSEMNTEIQQTASAINTRVNKLYTNINEDTGEVESVTTTTGYKFDENGLSISRSDSEFSALHNNTGTYYKDNDAIVSQTTKDGTITKDMVLYGRYYYGVDNDLDVENFTKDDAMFIAEMYEDSNGEVGFGHFLNNLGGN